MFGSTKMRASGNARCASAYASDMQGEVPTVDLLAKQARLQGLMVGSRRHQQDYVSALERSGVRPVLDRSFPLEQLADAFRYQASGVHFGKVVVEW